MKKTNFKKSKLSFKKAEKPDVERLDVSGLGEKVVTKVGSVEKVDDERWYPGKRALTDKERALRDRDCAGVKYSGVVPNHMHKELDEERRKNWVPPSEVEKMPMWRPVIWPLIQEEIGKQGKEVAVFMGSVDKDVKGRVVRGIAKVVVKCGAGWSLERVEKLVWQALFELMRDQGVVNIGAIKAVVKS